MYYYNCHYYDYIFDDGGATTEWLHIYGPNGVIVREFVGASLV